MPELVATYAMWIWVSLTVEVCRSDRNSIALFVHALQKTRWEEIYCKDSCHEQFEYFQMTIHNLLDTYIPKQLIIRKWQALYQNSLRQWAHREGHSALFKLYRARVWHARKYLRKSFYILEVAHLKDSNPRCWWKHTKQIIGQRGDSDASLKVLATSVCGGDYKKLANMINETYQSVTKDLLKLGIFTLPPPTNPVPNKYIINIENVEKTLAHINIFKALGPDLKWLVQCYLSPNMCYI